MVPQTAATSRSRADVPAATPVGAEALINAATPGRFTIDQLLTVLDVRGDVPPVPARTLASQHGGVLGAQQLGQQIVLAERLTPGKIVHSLHTLFSRPGDCRSPVWIDVEHLAHGRSVGALALSVRQDSEALSRTNMMLRAPEPDLGRHATTTVLPSGPETAESEDHLRTGPWEVRLVSPGAGLQREHWVRVPAAGDDPTIWRALIAQACEFLPLPDILLANGIPLSAGTVPANVTALVLSMTVTFFDEADIRDWMLYRVSGLHVAGGRTASRIEIFSGDGELRAEASVIGVLRQRS
ncbi:Acyl-CoA thioesterase [Frankia sp. AiPs1]|uniref:acyl-CoA thioesterase n=1 Tax=Frankia sp. AiPa1 TaxID=573492 RepID=UPI00202AEB18|nr:acyl-CoA thioesterase domain-containing protein [Frankia sp. AiPa1]MCL9760111.1 thioesterase family protein [Frankia sp. AiPa1]